MGTWKVRIEPRIRLFLLRKGVPTTPYLLYFLLFYINYLFISSAARTTSKVLTLFHVSSSSIDRQKSQTPWFWACQNIVRPIKFQRSVKTILHASNHMGDGPWQDNSSCFCYFWTHFYYWISSWFIVRPTLLLPFVTFSISIASFFFFFFFGKWHSIFSMLRHYAIHWLLCEKWTKHGCHISKLNLWFKIMICWMKLKNINIPNIRADNSYRVLQNLSRKWHKIFSYSNFRVFFLNK